MDILVNTHDLCGECPSWDPDEQALYWTDIDGQRLHRYLWREGRHELVQEGFSINGFTRQRDGSFVITNAQGFWLWRPGPRSTQPPTLLAASADGQECRLNDCLADPEGRVYAGSYHLDAEGNSAPSFLFRLDTDGSVHVVDEGIRFANGLALSPDNTRLYFTDLAARCVYVYDRQPADGSLQNRRVFLRLDSAEGLPDGLTVDADGFLWCAHWFGGCVTRYDPDGTRERLVRVPATQSSSLTFAGPDLDELIVTTAGLHNCLMLAPANYDPGSIFPGGPLYREHSPIRGRLKHRSAIALPAAPASHPL